MPISLKKPKKNSRGVYAVLWEKDNTGTLIVPTGQDMPLDVKIMVAESLLQEIGVPIRIERWMLKEK